MGRTLTWTASTKSCSPSESSRVSEDVSQTLSARLPRSTFPAVPVSSPKPSRTRSQSLLGNQGPRTAYQVFGQNRKDSRSYQEEVSAIDWQVNGSYACGCPNHCKNPLQRPGALLVSLQRQFAEIIRDTASTS